VTIEKKFAFSLPILFFA